MAQVIREKKSKKAPKKVPSVAAPSVEVDLRGTVEILHRYLTASLCRVVFHRVRTTERERQWSLFALMEFWIAVVLRAPPSLTQALEECAVGSPGWPKVPATSEAFFQRSRDLPWKFFGALWVDFLGRVVRQAPTNYGSDTAALRASFKELWVLDGSRLDAIAHRLKILHKERAVVLPGCIEAAYDLWRGIPRLLHFSANAAASEWSRVEQILPDIPEETLLLGDRLYASVKLFEALKKPQRWGLFRRNQTLSLRKQACLSRRWVDGGKLEDWCVEVGSGQTAPKQTLRYIRYTRDRVVYELLTNVLDPQKLSAVAAFNLYGHRWSIERMFFDLKEVLNLHRFYAGNPNAVAMQVYAATLVYTAMRIAQGRIAQAQGMEPEAISPAKLFPRLAAASLALTITEHTYQAICEANPGQRIRRPDPRQQKIGVTQLKNILVEKRTGKRRKRRFCRGRARWKSLAHVKGGKRFTSG